MFNDWFKIGPVTVHGYGFMIAVGILFAFWLSERLAKKQGLEYEKIDGMIFFIIIFGFIGAKLLYIFTVWDSFVQNPVVILSNEGFVVYGGIIAGIIAAWFYCKWKKWDFMKYANVLMPAVSLGQGFGRIGCFFAGCCYGIRTTAWYGVEFPAESLGPGAGIKVIPTELISSAGNFLIFAFLLRNLLKGKHPEDTAAWYLVLYGLGRFLVEFLRGDLIRGQIWIFSTSQFISIFVFLAGAFFLWNRQNHSDLKKEVAA